MLATFQEFLSGVIVENLHPDLQKVVTSGSGGYNSKQSQLAKAVKGITKKGELTGIEGNMPKGSARAYMKHAEPQKIKLDGEYTTIPTGTKVAIRAALDKHHDHKAHQGMHLGAMQNHAEAGDHWVNDNYRILRHKGMENGIHHYESNKESGIFPPLIDHDDVGHEWSHVGHARDIQPGEFRKLTKHPDFPKGISHGEFVDSLLRFHDQNNGKYHENAVKDAKLDHIDQHPLVQKFQDYHGNTGNSPNDLAQKKNMGVFEHPDGSHHIVARDHGFSAEVQHAYQKARQTASQNWLRKWDANH